MPEEPAHEQEAESAPEPPAGREWVSTERVQGSEPATVSGGVTLEHDD